MVKRSRNKQPKTDPNKRKKEKYIYINFPRKSKCECALSQTNRSVCLNKTPLIRKGKFYYYTFFIEFFYVFFHLMRTQKLYQSFAFTNFLCFFIVVGAAAVVVMLCWVFRLCAFDKT